MTARQIILNLVEGDTAPNLPVRFVGLDLSDYDSIAMKIEKPDGSRYSKPLTPDEEDPELGFITWEPGDLTVGRHRAEFEFLADGDRFTLPRRYPILFDVRRDLG